ncbi:calmodulin-binding transcription activator 3 isoform X2 [Hevea brasiliensis]|uniref:calmodulin-binding transcription activator 3 isoform X2 n=1 Tax=Hevea brasiliensis TaxID=3981 RepID=UPI0025ECCC99|nr:calmodulin-binding transcription activator 3 isoform X2 [Hevea brasiliensis]
MAEARRYPLGNQLDIQQILVEAKHRWLRPAEICEILRNYKKFRIAPEPQHMPSSGSLFLFDRKVLRYFRKDGHNWRKKKDGKTVKEAHERLKSGSVDVLHCYYAHGEGNENFQRRSYWMLEEELSHIVLVHYRDVKGNKANFNHVKEHEEAIPYPHEIEDTIPHSEMETSVSSNFHHDNYQVPAQTTDTMSMNSAQASEYEDAESGYNHQASSGLHSFIEVQQPAREKIDAGLLGHHDPVSFSSSYQGKLSAVPGRDFFSLPHADKAEDTKGAGLTYQPLKHFNLPSWENVLENYAPGIEAASLQPPFSSPVDTAGILPKQEDEILKQLLVNSLPLQKEWQNFEDASSHLSKWAMDQKLHPNSTADLTTSFHEQELVSGDLTNALELFWTHGTGHPAQNDVQIQWNTEQSITPEGKSIYSSSVKQRLLDRSLSEEGLKKLDSFNRWMSKELGDVNESHMQTSSGPYWDTVENENGIDDPKIPSQAHLDTYVLGPSLSQDQFFSIIDFSPNWAYVGSEIKVLITGRFLKSREEAENCKWSCMFGEVEVQAEVIADGVLRCQTPLNKAGMVPFYVTCSDRVACSEVREFEYRVSHIQDVNITDCFSSRSFIMRFGKLLSLNSFSLPKCNTSNIVENTQLSNKISSLLEEDNEEWDQMLKRSSEAGVSLEKVKEELLQKLLKDRLHAWLLQKAAEGGKGPSVLDEGGQGVLHFAAALGYDWALEPTIIAGVSVNFRDMNGWTALHWAASCGSERTVVSLVILGAAPGALTDPTPKYPTGRTPADLASANGHKGIAGYLAESALSAHLSSLNLDKQDGDVAGVSGAKTVQIVPEHGTFVTSDGDLSYGLPLKDSLAAVCNATQAVARIHEVFRVQSFQKKQLKELGDDKYGMSNECALSFIAVKALKPGQHDEPVHAAAIRIQNKFRSWKGRKEFLIIRQRIVKIQAHVRGHQVRKNYRKIVWSVGIVEKVILRWRRKRSGLRGFKSEAPIEGPSKQDTLSKEDDYDFFKEGRKQTEARSQIALARVKSMHQYPEARDQYRRLLNAVTEIQENKTLYDRINNSEATAEFDDLIDLEALLDDDAVMPTAS